MTKFHRINLPAYFFKLSACLFKFECYFCCCDRVVRTRFSHQSQMKLYEAKPWCVTPLNFTDELVWCKYGILTLGGYGFFSQSLSISIMVAKGFLYFINSWNSSWACTFDDVHDLHLYDTSRDRYYLLDKGYGTCCRFFHDISFNDSLLNCCCCYLVSWFLSFSGHLKWLHWRWRFARWL